MNPDLHYGQLDSDKYVKLRLKACAKLLEGKIKPGSKILEIGCYTASLLDFLPKGVDYYGIDFDEGAIAIAKSKGAKVEKANLDNQEIGFAFKFDVVICSEVLEHTINPPRLMQNIKQLVKDDGFIIISLPNENTIYHRLMSLFGLGIDMCAFELYKHLHLPTIKQNKEFVNKYFRILKTDYHINPSAKGSRAQAAGKILTLIPDCLWFFLARLFPGLFARGIIFLCCLKDKNVKK